MSATGDTSRLRVLHVDTATEWRGGQTQLLHLLGPGADEVHVALHPDASVREVVAALGVPVHPIRSRGVLRGTRSLARLIRDLAPDVVAAHTSHAHHHAVLALLVAHAPRPALVVHRRLDFPPHADPLTRLKYARPDRYVAVSDAVATVLAHAGVPRERIDVVYDGVDPEPLRHPRRSRAEVRAALGVPTGTLLVGALGALVAHKGHEVLIDALSEAPLRDRPVHTVIAGEGSRRDALVTHLGRRGLAGRVHLPGHIDDVPSFLAAIDCFCHPSHEEGMGQAVVEALLAGVPVVATAAGGVPEVLRHGRHGRLVPVGDAGALSSALDEVLDSGSVPSADPASMRDELLRRHGVDQLMARTRAVYAKAHLVRTRA